MKLQIAQSESSELLLVGRIHDVSDDFEKRFEGSLDSSIVVLIDKVDISHGTKFHAKISEKVGVNHVVSTNFCDLFKYRD